MKLNAKRSNRPAISSTGLILHVLLKVLALNYNRRQGSKKCLMENPLDFIIGNRKENGSVFSAENQLLLTGNHFCK